MEQMNDKIERKSENQDMSSASHKGSEHNKATRVPIIVPKRREEHEEDNQLCSDYPHCTLPTYYFDLMLSKMKQEDARV